jgi:flagellar assembly protein FliH
MQSGKFPGDKIYRDKEVSVHPKESVVAPFEYASMGAAAGDPVWPSLTPEQNQNQNQNQEQAQLVARVEHLQAEEAALAARLEQRVAAARAEGYEAGKREQQEDLARKSEQSREALARALADFAAERDRYLAQIEPDIVRLALAIASRILHREAQMDPLLLSGAVRVALGQLSDATEVRLRVPAAEADLWREMLRLLPNLPLRPEVAPEEQMQAGECRLETHLGSVDLGVKAQLAEIERGFFDLLAQRVKIPHAATA